MFLPVKGTKLSTDLVSTFVDDLQDVCRQRVLLPVPDGVRDLSSLGGDAVVFSEDTPVSVRHLLQLLLRPMSVVPALLCLLLAHLLQSYPKRKKQIGLKLIYRLIYNLLFSFIQSTLKFNVLDLFCFVSLTLPAPSPPVFSSFPSGRHKTATALSSAASSRYQR